MYVIIAVYGILNGILQNWKNVDIGMIPTDQLLGMYRKLVIAVEPETPASVGPTANPTILYIDMDDLRAEYNNDTIPLYDLITKSNISFPTVNFSPLNPKPGLYQDAFKSGYNIQPYDSIYNINLPVSKRDSVLLTRTTPSVDYIDFVNHCLVTVNGYYHFIDTDGIAGVLVKDANKTKEASNIASIGIYCFKNACSLQCVPITADMITSAGTDLIDGFFLTIPSTIDIANKTIAFSLGGYLSINDPFIYTQINQNTYKITINQNNNFLNRLCESLKFTDMSEFDIFLDTNESGKYTYKDIDRVKATSDATVKLFMTMTKSFIIVFNSSSMYTAKSYVNPTSTPGRIISYNKPTFPVVLSSGRMPEYWSIEDDRQWALYVQSNDDYKFIFNTNIPKDTPVISNQEVPSKPVTLSGNYLFEIGSNF